MRKKIFALTMTGMILCCIVLFSGCSNDSYKVKKMVNGNDYVILDDARSVMMIYDDIGMLNVGISDNKNCLVRFARPDGKDNPDGKYTHYTITDELTKYGDDYSRYAYSDDGYIAYVEFAPSSYLDKKWCFWYYIYSVNEDKLYTFDSMQNLVAYTNKYSIKLGDWLWTCDKIEPEKSIVKNNNWELITTGVDISVVRNNHNDVFSGVIDKYYSNENFLSFRFELPYDITRRYGTDNTYFSFLDNENAGNETIDKYVVVNTVSDEFEIFDTKDDAEKFMSLENAKIKWEKVKY